MARWQRTLLKLPIVSFFFFWWSKSALLVSASLVSEPSPPSLHISYTGSCSRLYKPLVPQLAEWRSLVAGTVGKHLNSFHHPVCNCKLPLCHSRLPQLRFFFVAFRLSHTQSAQGAPWDLFCVSCSSKCYTLAVVSQLLDLCSQWVRTV